VVEGDAHPEVLVQLRDELVADAEGFNVLEGNTIPPKRRRGGGPPESSAVACRKRYAIEPGKPNGLLSLMATTDTHGANPAQSATARVSGRCMAVRSGGLPTTNVVQASFTSNDIDGITFNWLTTDATPRSRRKRSTKARPIPELPPVTKMIRVPHESPATLSGAVRL
jgi:hypothetical protein